MTERPRFLNLKQASAIRDLVATPVYVYDEPLLRRQANAALAFPHAFGLTVRYAMKASPNAALLRFFDGLGLHIDASSGYEVHRAVRAGIAPWKISLSGQEMPADFAGLVESGMEFNACSLRQLDDYGKGFPETSVGLRINPGIGSGGTKKTNVGGPSASFGIWHEYAEQAREIVAKHRLRIVRIHTHIGSGGDPEVWQRVAAMSLNQVEAFEHAEVLNLGGGFKVGRMSGDESTDLQRIGEPVRALFLDLYQRTGRKIHLEIEPGTYMVANACSLLTTVQDIVDTGEEGYRFLKLDTGMTELLRPSLYASQHPIVVLPRREIDGATANYVVVGHCCESGDLMTPSREAWDTLAPRRLAEARVGDLALIEGVGAYCSAMSAKNYNSFPEAPEVLLREDGQLQVIRRRQTLEQMVANETPPPETDEIPSSNC